MSKRIFLPILLVVLFLLLFFALTNSEVLYSQIEGDAKETLRTSMQTFKDDYSSADIGAEEISSLLGVGVCFLDKEFKVTDVSDERFAPSESDIKKIKISFDGGSSIYVSDSDEKGHSYVNICESTDNKIVKFTVEIFSRTEVYISMIPSLVIYVCIGVLLSLILSLIVTSFVIKHVKELALNAIGNDKHIDAKYVELKPIADVINLKNEHVRNAQKSKDEFISNVTHEMNTPLTSIHGFAELIASGSLPASKTQSAGKTIAAQSERLGAMIKQILNYSAIDDDLLTPYDVDISILTKEVLNNFEPMLKDKNITLLRDIEDGVIVKSRHERITEILDNLVSNAIKYNKQNGKITVTVRNKMLIVDDTGIGISQDELKHIFSRFYTVNKSHGENMGFGLGLPIVKKLCDKSGWKLYVDSTPGEGTTFRIDFSE